jgi:hypothetical protein
MTALAANHRPAIPAALRFIWLVADLYVLAVGALLAVINLPYGLFGLHWQNVAVGLGGAAIGFLALVPVRRQTSGRHDLIPAEAPPTSDDFSGLPRAQAAAEARDFAMQFGVCLTGVGLIVGVIFMAAYGLVESPTAFVGCLFPLPGLLFVASVLTKSGQ